MNKIFRLTNTAKSGPMVVARDEDPAKGIGMQVGTAKKRENLKCKELTNFPQHKTSSLIACIKCGGGYYQWIVIRQPSHERWFGTREKLVK